MKSAGVAAAEGPSAEAGPALLEPGDGSRVLGETSWQSVVPILDSGPVPMIDSWQHPLSVIGQTPSVFDSAQHPLPMLYTW